MCLREELREFITVTSLRGKIPEGFSDDYDLIEKDALDSMAFVDLITHVAEKYEIDIDEDDISPDNFGSVSRLAGFIGTKRD